MRILLWGELFWPYLGGAELFASDLMLSLRPRGFDFTVVTSHDSLDLPDKDEFRGIRIHRFPFRSALVPRRIEDLAVLRRRVAKLCEEIAPDLIHLNGVSPSAFFCLHAARTSDTPMLVRLNAELVPVQSRPRGSLLEHALQRASWVTSVSAAVLRQAENVLPGVRQRSSVIYNGVEVADDEPPSPETGAPRLLCVGRLVSAKGFDLAVDAFASVLHRWPRARLMIAGDGPERDSLERQVAAQGVSDAVDFVGWLAPERVPEAISHATLVLVPSRAEGLPGVAIQAAAMGRPVVATRTGGLPEIVQDGVTGFLVEPDASPLADAITRLLEEPATAGRMGAEGWRRARSVFAAERCWDEYETLYRRLALSHS